MQQTFRLGFRPPLLTFVSWVFVVFGTIACVAALLQSESLATLLQHSVHSMAGWIAASLPWLLRAGLVLFLAGLAWAAVRLVKHAWAGRQFA